MKLNIWDIILTFGILQGLITGTIILLRKDKNPIAAKTISGILFVCVLATVAALMGMLPPSQIIRNLERFIPFNLTFLIGPLIYFHVRSIANVEFKIGKTQLWHCAPALFNLFPVLLHFGQWFTSMFGIHYFQSTYLFHFLHHYSLFTEALAWLHITAYLILSRKYLLDGIEPESRQHRSYYNWLKYLLNYFLIIQVIWCPFMLISLTPYKNLLLEYPFTFYFLYIPLVGFIYWVGIKYLVDTSPSLRASIDIDHNEINNIEQQLERLIVQDKLYLDSTLNLAHLAQKVEISSRRISWYFNQYLKTNFNDFVNRYRVDEVKLKLSDPANDNLTISAIALESGFSSVSTFQRAFKSMEHMSPKEFKRHSRKKLIKS